MNMRQIRARLGGLHYRMSRKAKRCGMAWRYATGRLNESDANTMRYECSVLSGVYGLSYFSREDVLANCQDRFGDNPELPCLVDSACNRVWNKWSGTGDDCSAAEEWAMELVQEYAAQDNVILADSWNEPAAEESVA